MIDTNERRRPTFWAVSYDPFRDPLDPKWFHRNRVEAICHLEDGRWEKALVSWSAIGQVSAERADLFAQALAKAVEMARAMDKEHGLV